MKKWKKMFSGAGALAVCAGVAKLLGAFFRIPLTNIIGAEGIGLYQMVFPLYTVLLTISSGGLSIAVSKLVASRLAAKDENGAANILKAAVLSLSVLAAGAAVFLVLFRERIAALQGNEKAAAAYLGIAPSVVFVAIIASLRGYFQGRGNMLPSGISQIVEQLVKLGAGLFFAAKLLDKGVAWAVFGAALGVSISELAAMLLLLLQFWFFYSQRKKRRIISFKRLHSMEAAGLLEPEIFMELSGIRPSEINALNDADTDIKKKSGVMKSLYKIAIPVTLGSLIMPLTQVIDSVMVINVLAAGGMTRLAATSLFGLVSGPISSLINMPLVITLSISIALLPKMAFLNERRTATDCAQNGGDARTLVGKSLFLTLVVALPCVAVFMFFPRQLVQTLYSRGLSAEQLRISAALLRIESLSILFVSLVQVSTAVLQGADKAHRPALNLLYGALVKVLVTLALLPWLGIKGAAIASVLCYGVTSAIDIVYMLKVVRPKITLFRAVFMPVAGSLLLAAAAWLGFRLASNALPAPYSFLLGLAFGGSIYILFLLVTKTVKIKELFN